MMLQFHYVDASTKFPQLLLKPLGDNFEIQFDGRIESARDDVLARFLELRNTGAPPSQILVILPDAGIEDDRIVAVEAPGSLPRGPATVEQPHLRWLMFAQ